MSTLSVTLNGVLREASPGETLLTLARRFGQSIPTLCEFQARHHTPGTCRICLVALTRDGTRRLVTSCDTPVRAGDVIETRAEDVIRARRLQGELLFLDHCTDCETCSSQGHCELEDLRIRLGADVSQQGRRLTRPTTPDTSAKALVFEPDRCVRCLRCVEVCRSVQGIGAITLEGDGTNTRIGFKGEKWGESAHCVQCGQCTKVCPTGALHVKDESLVAERFLSDPEVTTVIQMAPAARLALANEWGLPAGTNLEGQMIAALKALGADYVMDTRFAADVTIMEEVTELMNRLTSGQKGPVMTSCCPGWINYVEQTAPALIPNLSTTRSPQAIFARLVRHWFPVVTGVERDRIRHISLMPCTAKKDERLRPTLASNGDNDVDVVLTTQEFTHLLKRRGIDLLRLPVASFDQAFMTKTSSAGQLFASTGGVMEAALRTFSHFAGVESAPIVFEAVRGMKTMKEATLETRRFGRVKVAVVHGLREAGEIVRRIEAGTAPWHFIEVMACPGGCVGGGGTQRVATPAMQQTLYKMDDEATVRAAHENPEVHRLYRDFLGAPCSDKAHALLHCHYTPQVPRQLSLDIQAWAEQLTLTDEVLN